MKITYHEPKRAQTLSERGLDFAHADRVFAGKQLVLLDDRQDYGEERYQTIGFLQRTMVMVVWTSRGDNTRHVMSMRKCNAKERKRYKAALE